ncbi:THAP domain-containing protein 2-like [Centruroides sculpturatus]|uniref:THAP domain-containing protein 2-like n=1 Tax=Centruroides sculpturatus TaxID=218467 RepID=UPI000C6EE68E|nr:THAP domain-containing protein 2-like [Centruroides sculpturatus]
MSKSKVFCCVQGCNSKYNSLKNISFHHFPKAGKVKIINKVGKEENIERKKAWELALKMEKKMTPSMRVCSLHFIENDFILPGVPSKKKCLKKTAVPSQNLPVTNKQFFDHCVRKNKHNKLSKPIQETINKTHPETSHNSKPTVQDIEAARILLELEILLE